VATNKKSAQSVRQYWLFKSEPEAYSIADLARETAKRTFWDGVRNYQARNLLRDTIKLGDRVLFYHSNSEPMAIVGTAEVVRTGYPDHTAFDPQDHHYDPKSKPEQPTWFMVDVELLQVFPKPVTRDDLKACLALNDMMVLRRGARLSIQPVTAAEWQVVHRLAGTADKP
jgi:predicted RNA-binding protein with PUA-like domain